VRRLYDALYMAPEVSTSLGIAVVVSRYNASITDRLLAGALEAHGRLRPGGVEPVVIDAPGAFELAAISAAAARSGRFEGIVALACVIKGETSHDRYICEAVANALAVLPIHLGVPAAFGVLTVDSIAQAEARAGGAKGNKGAEAMEALLDTIDTIEAIRSGRVSAGSARPDKAGVVR